MCRNRHYVPLSSTETMPLHRSAAAWQKTIVLKTLLNSNVCVYIYTCTCIALVFWAARSSSLLTRLEKITGCVLPVESNLNGSFLSLQLVFFRYTSCSSVRPRVLPLHLVFFRYISCSSVTPRGVLPLNLAFFRYTSCSSVTPRALPLHLVFFRYTSYSSVSLRVLPLHLVFFRYPSCSSVTPRALPLHLVFFRYTANLPYGVLQKVLDNSCSYKTKSLYVDVLGSGMNSQYPRGFRRCAEV